METVLARAGDAGREATTFLMRQIKNQLTKKPDRLVLIGPGNREFFTAQQVIATLPGMAEIGNNHRPAQFAGLKWRRVGRHRP